MSNSKLTKEDKQSMGNELEKRLSTYRGRILDLVGEFPDTEAGRHVLDQLLRSGTAPGATR